MNYINSVVYQATVKNNQGGDEFYVGLAKKIKNRYGKHKASLSVYKPEGNTTLFTHFWTVKGADGDPKVEWKILEKNIPTYNQVTIICRLCLREKFNIVLKIFYHIALSIKTCHMLMAELSTYDMFSVGF